MRWSNFKAEFQHPVRRPPDFVCSYHNMPYRLANWGTVINMPLYTYVCVCVNPSPYMFWAQHMLYILFETLINTMQSQYSSGPISKARVVCDVPSRVTGESTIQRVHDFISDIYFDNFLKEGVSISFCSCEGFTCTDIKCTLQCQFQTTSAMPIVTMTSQWVWWRLKSPASPLLTQPFIQAQIKENIKAPRHWPLCGEFTSGRWIPRQNGQ